MKDSKPHPQIYIMKNTVYHSKAEWERGAAQGSLKRKWQVGARTFSLWAGVLLHIWILDLAGSPSH